MRQKVFSGYEIFVVTMLTILQFTLILDFMALFPLGPFLMPDLTEKVSGCSGSFALTKFQQDDDAFAV